MCVCVCVRERERESRMQNVSVLNVAVSKSHLGLKLLINRGGMSVGLVGHVVLFKGMRNP